jgi:hypothetical protein
VDKRREREKMYEEESEGEEYGEVASAKELHESRPVRDGSSSVSAEACRNGGGKLEKGREGKGEKEKNVL